MNDLILITNQTPGLVTFKNFEEVRANLQQYVRENFADVDYSALGAAAAEADAKQLKQYKDVISKTKKKLEQDYSAPYRAVEAMLDELTAILDGPYKAAKAFADGAEKDEKREEILRFAAEQADALGPAGRKIVESPKFFNEKWLNKGCRVKEWQDGVRAVLAQASQDLQSIRAAGGEKADTLAAVYYTTLSMDSVKNTMETLRAGGAEADAPAVPSENNVLGYKVLKITATEDQMAAILDQLALMGADVEELEDGMPKPMPELTEPDFDSFVAFDIETTGTFGAASGDGEAKITEIGAVRVIDGKVTEKFDMLANPGRAIVPRVARLTGITNEMVKDEPPVDEVIRAFRDFVGNSILVGHNIKSSDLRYITKAAKKAGVHFDMPFLDTYPLARKQKARMGWDGVSLPELAKFYGLQHKEAHRAWSDAEVNAKVYFALREGRNNI